MVEEDPLRSRRDSDDRECTLRRSDDHWGRTRRGRSESQDATVVHGDGLRAVTRNLLADWNLNGYEVRLNFEVGLDLFSLRAGERTCSSLVELSDR